MRGAMERRILGNTGERLSVVGFGGIVVMDEEPAQAAKYVSRAIDRGINYFDVAPSYGNSEEKLGPALRPYRKQVFLACKTLKRTAAESEKEIHKSLKLLKTDHFDLYQLHGVNTMAEVETIFGPKGAMETFLKARDRGLSRFLGFTSHSEEAALALMERFAFDSILFPFNWAAWLKGEFGKKVLEMAQRKGIGCLALKTLAKRKWMEGEEKKWPKCWYKPVDTYEEAAIAVRFTLSMPITAAVSPSHAELLWWMCDAAEHIKPLAAQEQEQLMQKAREQDVIFPEAS
jgi:aryl-alcohol dehydrogenase-like predicted oxidoreductase